MEALTFHFSKQVFSIYLVQRKEKKRKYFKYKIGQHDRVQKVGTVSMYLVTKDLVKFHAKVKDLAGLKVRKKKQIQHRESNPQPPTIQLFNVSFLLCRLYWSQYKGIMALLLSMKVLMVLISLFWKELGSTRVLREILVLLDFCVLQ